MHDQLKDKLTAALAELPPEAEGAKSKALVYRWHLRDLNMPYPQTPEQLLKVQLMRIDGMKAGAIVNTAAHAHAIEAEREVLKMMQEVLA